MNRSTKAWLVPASLAGWQVSDLGSDIVAALTLVAIAIPEQMATSRLGAFPPTLGFWVFVAGSLSVALFSASRVLSVGADSTITPIFAGSLALLVAAGTAQYFGLASLLALMVGVLVLLSGIFRLGWIANLLSVPVLTGFLAGIAVHIATSQLPGLLGLSLPHLAFFPTLAAVVAHRGDINLYALGCGAFVFAVTLIAERIDKRIPAAIIAVILVTAAVALFGLKARGVPVLGALPPAWPHLFVPQAGFDDLVRLLPFAILVAFVVLLQTAATDRSFAPQSGGNVNRDYVGIGIGNLVSGLLGGFPANSSPPRTAAVAESGGRSGVTNLAAAAIVALFAVYGVGLLSDVPVAALAGLLFFVAQRIVRVPVMLATWREARGEFALIVATIVAIVAMPIATGVGIGIGLSILHGVWTITRAGLVPFARVPGTTIWWPRSSVPQGETVPGIDVVGFQAPLFFLNAALFRREFDNLLGNTQPKLVVLEASNMVEIDFSGAEAFKDFAENLKARGIALAIARLESLRARAALERFGVVDLIGESCISRSVEDAVRTWQEKASAAP